MKKKMMLVMTVTMGGDGGSDETMAEARVLSDMSALCRALQTHYLISSLPRHFPVVSTSGIIYIFINRDSRVQRGHLTCPKSHC